MTSTTCAVDPVDRSVFLGIAKRQLPLGYSNDEFIFTADIARRLWFATYGILRPLSFMLKELREVAGEHQVMNSAVLMRAFKQRIWFGAEDHRNPFHKDFDWKPLVFSKEPYEAEEEEGDAHGVIA